MMRDVGSAVLAFCMVYGSALAQAPAQPNAEPRRLTVSVSVDGVYSPDGRWIAFAANRAGNDPEVLDIYRMSTAGADVQALTRHPANDETPAISPDGRRIAFMSMRSGDPEIYVMNADGGEVARLTHDSGWDIHPRWAPDGRAILFNSTRGSKNTADPELFEIYAVKPDGSGLRQLTHDKEVSTYATYSPDGAKIIYRRIVGGNSEVFVMDADGAGQINLTRNAAFDGWPTWSRDGHRIAFASNRGGPEDVYEIYEMNADGTNVVQRTQLGSRSTAPEYSPDGGTILFTRSGGGSADLYSLPALQR
jgi:TolB protein